MIEMDEEICDSFNIPKHGASGRILIEDRDFIILDAFKNGSNRKDNITYGHSKHDITRLFSHFFDRNISSNNKCGDQK